MQVLWSSYIDLRFNYDERPDLALVEKTLKENEDIALVYATHNETVTGLLNPIKKLRDSAPV